MADSGQKVRTVVLLQYKYGPSNSTTNLPQSSGFGLNELPENLAGFLKFVKECEHFYAHEQRNPANPVLVHCMNGVSRSAVFLVTHTLIQIVDTYFQDSQAQLSTISDTLIRLVKQMRSKRKYMIQSTYHLKYSYNAILYYAKDILIKQGILTNLTTKTIDTIPVEPTTNHHFQPKSTTRQQSIDSIDILNDLSLVSIQDSAQSKTSNSDDESNPLDNLELDLNNLTCLTQIKPVEAKPNKTGTPIFSSATLEDLCNPNKFTLNLGDDGNKRKQKITKNDFLKTSNLTTNIVENEGVINNGVETSNDPFFSLDPLRKQ